MYCGSEWCADRAKRVAGIRSAWLGSDRAPSLAPAARRLHFLAGARAITRALDVIVVRGPGGAPHTAHSTPDVAGQMSIERPPVAGRVAFLPNSGSMAMTKCCSASLIATTARPI